MTDCVFCQIVARELPADIVYETDDWLGFLDIKPVNPGHTLLVSKAHYENLFDLPPALLAKLGGELQKLGRAVKAATGAAGLNLGMNNERAAGQLINHAHCHLIPRFTGDGHRHWHGKTIPTKEELTAVSQKIKTALAKQKAPV